MADPAAPVFTPAHKVVIDCMTFLTAEIIADDRRPLVLDLLAEALPHAKPLNRPAIDGLIDAAGPLLKAGRMLAAKKDPDAGIHWCRAMGAADQALTTFAWVRLAQSADDFRDRNLANGAAT